MGKLMVNTNRETAQSNLARSDQGFTLTEIIVVVVIFTAIAGFAIPGYGKMVRKSRERTAILNLTALHAANEIYTAKKGEYLVGAGLSEVNLRAPYDAGLEIDIRPIDMNYSYTRTAVAAYTATAAWGGASSFTVRVNQRPISNSNNPCCVVVNTCPTLPVCI